MGGRGYCYAMLPIFCAMFAVNEITNDEQSEAIHKEEDGGWQVVLCISLPWASGICRTSVTPAS